MVPLHPFLAHIPLILALFMPFVLWSLIILIAKKKISSQGWWSAVVIQLMIVIFAYIALSSGEGEEDLVAQFVPKRFIGKHENMAEVFSGLSVILLGVMIVINFVQEKLAKKLRILAAVFSLIPLGVGLYTGRLGGEIAYAYGGAEAYYSADYEDHDDGQMGILPTPGMNTSESEFPVDELELNNPDSDYDEYEREKNAGESRGDETYPEDRPSFPEDEEDRSYEAD